MNMASLTGKTYHHEHPTDIVHPSHQGNELSWTKRVEDSQE
jgi:hypothetical protein